MKPFLSVVIPCFNEEKRFTEGLSHFQDYLNKQEYLWEIILVNDGSGDSTLNLMQKAKEKSPKIKLISYQENRGKGYAISKGVHEAEGEIILFSDIDHSVPMETFEKFQPHFKEGWKVVIGSRRVKGSRFVKKQNKIRELLGRCFTAIVRLSIDWEIKDATCGFKAFENKTAKKIFEKITIFDWAFDAEIIYICKINKIDYKQVPVEWADAKGSKVNVLKDAVKSLAGLLKIRVNGIQNKYS